jgi:hypothetical protein
MFYKPSSRRQKLLDVRVVQSLLDFLAGVHAANGLAHGVQPPANSRARYPNKPE